MKFGFDADTLDAVWIFCNNKPRINIIFFFMGFFFTASMPVVLVWLGQKSQYYILFVNDTYYNILGFIVTFAAIFWFYGRNSKASLTKFIKSELNLVFIDQAKFTKGFVAYESYLIFINLLPYTLGFFIVRFFIIFTGVTGQYKPVELFFEFLWILFFQLITYLWIYLLRIFWQMLYLSRISRSSASFIYLLVLLFLFIQSSWKIGTVQIFELFGYTVINNSKSAFPPLKIEFSQNLLDQIHQFASYLSYQAKINISIIELLIINIIILLLIKKFRQFSLYSKMMVSITTLGFYIFLYYLLKFIQPYNSLIDKIVEKVTITFEKVTLFCISAFLIALNLSTCTINTNQSILDKIFHYIHLPLSGMKTTNSFIYNYLNPLNCVLTSTCSFKVLPEIELIQYLESDYYLNFTPYIQVNPFFNLFFPIFSIACLSLFVLIINFGVHLIFRTRIHRK